VAAQEEERAVTAGQRGIEQTFARAGIILDALAEGRRKGLRFTDIVAATGFSKATVHRLLAGMVAHGLVEAAGERGRFHLGYRLGAWGAAARDRHGLLDLALPHLDALAEATGDTVYLSVRTGVLSLCVARREGSHPIRVLTLTPGDRNALGVGSASLALLAFQPSDPEIDRILADPEHIRARERRGIEEATIRHLVADSRQRGYAQVRDIVPGIVALGVPALSGSPVPTVALSIATVAARLEEPRLAEVVDRLRATARTIGDLMAGNADLVMPA
jgi:DNA-binding IclR family transcriptional regulator